jgi:hypothetical protein
MIETLPGHRRVPNLRSCAVEQAQSGCATPRATPELPGGSYQCIVTHSIAAGATIRGIHHNLLSLL